MQEIWKVYKTTNNTRWGSIVWEVSNWGRVKKNGVLHEPGCLNTGYKWFAHTFLHRAVAELFIPNSENKPQVNHIDGDKLNNHISNLEWVTQSENIKHAYATGLIDKEKLKKAGKIGGKIAGPIIREKYGHLTIDEAREIRSLSAKGYKYNELAKKYNVSYNVVCKVVNNRTYKEEA